MSVAFWPGMLGAAVAPRWALMAVGLPLCSWLDPRKLDPPITGLFALSILYAAGSLMWVPYPMFSALDLFHLILFGLAVLAGAELTDIDPCMTAIAWGLVASAALSIIQLAGWSPVEQAQGPAGLFYNKLVLGETVAPVLVWCAYKRQWMLAAILCVPLILSGSRDAVFAAALLLAISNRWLFTGFSVLVTYGIMASIYGWFPVHSYDVHSFAQRLQIWRSTWGDLGWIGYGIGSFADLHPRWEYAHSDLLQCAYELGIGAVFLVAGIARTVCAAGPSAERAALLVLCIEAAFSFPLHMPTTVLVAGLLVGYLARDRRTLRDSGFVGGDGVGARRQWSNPQCASDPVGG